MRTVILSCAIAWTLSVVGVAQTITVPGDYTTIQAAIDNVAPGGTILVSPGLYVESLLVDPGDVYGTGNRGEAAFTIEGTGPGVVIQYEPFSTVRMAGWNPLITTNSGR